jgi:tetratricopeptide (TPR) repeat protein
MISKYFCRALLGGIVFLGCATEHTVLGMGLKACVAQCLPTTKDPFGTMEKTEEEESFDVELKVTPAQLQAVKIQLTQSVVVVGQIKTEELLAACYTLLAQFIEYENPTIAISLYKQASQWGSAPAKIKFASLVLQRFGPEFKGKSEEVLALQHLEELKNNLKENVIVISQETEVDLFALLGSIYYGKSLNELSIEYFNHALKILERYPETECSVSKEQLQGYLATVIGGT